jgi:hypothetical protein
LRLTLRNRREEFKEAVDYDLKKKLREEVRKEKRDEDKWKEMVGTTKKDVSKLTHLLSPQQKGEGGVEGVV